MQSGITEPGSYGAPLFNQNKQIVGQLHGGESDCEDPIDDYFGKLSHSWSLGLKEFLDPDDTGVTELNGHLIQLLQYHQDLEIPLIRVTMNVIISQSNHLLDLHNQIRLHEVVLQFVCFD